MCGNFSSDSVGCACSNNAISVSRGSCWGFKDYARLIIELIIRILHLMIDLLEFMIDAIIGPV